VSREHGARDGDGRQRAALSQARQAEARDDGAEPEHREHEKEPRKRQQGAVADRLRARGKTLAVRDERQQQRHEQPAGALLRGLGAE